MSHIKNIIFDLDGTLIDSSDGVVEAVNYSLKMMGDPEQPPDIIKPFIGYPLSKMYLHFSDKPVKELYHHFQIKAAETVVESTVILPHVEQVLKELQNNKYTMAIATTKIRIHVEGIIDKLNWHRLFPIFAGGDEVKKVKPEPDIFKLVVSRMKADPEKTIVVGDTENDIYAAHAVPLPVIAVKSPYNGHDKRLADSKPDYFINSIKELLKTIENINE